MKLTAAGLSRVPGLDGIEAVTVARGLEWLGGLVFFDTSGNIPKSAGRPISVIAAAPNALYKGSIHSEKDLAVLEVVMEENSRPVGDQGFPAGGLCGWVDYEGNFVFGDFKEMLIRDEASEEWWEIGSLSGKIREKSANTIRIGPFYEETGRDKFLASVARVKRWIEAGDIYQVNVAQSFYAEIQGHGSLFSFYEMLRDTAPAPMSAWMALDGKEIVSTSPELFLKISGKGIETRPIKGTRPRYGDVDKDRQSAVELQTSPKEISELVMITDLLRNDLGQVCEFGSVEVTEMLQLESLAQVHHLVSTVKGTLRQNESALRALAACFPGGSITGAPKKRAMEIISEIEDGPRGIYCGAMGWLGFNGESQFNIAIRTLVREGTKLSYSVGAGIVADSDAEKEYEETMQKGSGMRMGVERFRKTVDAGII